MKQCQLKTRVLIYHFRVQKIIFILRTKPKNGASPQLIFIFSNSHAELREIEQPPYCRLKNGVDIAGKLFVIQDKLCR